MHDRDALLSYVRDRLRELFDAENSFVILLDADGRPRIQSSNLDSIEASGLPISETILNRALNRREAIIIDNATLDEDLREQSSVLRYQITSVMCAPLIVGDKAIGALQFDQRGEPSPFTTDDLRLLSLFADHAATAFHNLELIERLHETVVEIRSAQTSIVQSERMAALGEMAAGIAHDFNNTLFVALGLCDVLLAREGIDDEARTSIQTIRTCALDAANTIRRLHTFARGSEGEGGKRETFSPRKIVEEMPEFTRHKWHGEALKRGASIAVEIDAQPTPFIEASPSEVREILVNLIFNATDAIESSGTITLRSGSRDGRVFVSVEDDGIGIDGPTRERIFNPFFSTKGARGCGFGLSTCTNIAQRLGGRIDCWSEPGVGSRFTLWLPSSDEREAPPEKARPASSAHYDLLVVDDDQLVLDTIRRLLETLGHRVTASTSPDEAIELVNARRFDALVTDLGMPSMTGTDLARSVREAGHDFPILLLTGWKTDLDPGAEILESVDGVLSKPVTMESLDAELSKHLRK